MFWRWKEVKCTLHSVVFFLLYLTTNSSCFTYLVTGWHISFSKRLMIRFESNILIHNEVRIKKLLPWGNFSLPFINGYYQTREKSFLEWIPKIFWQNFPAMSLLILSNITTRLCISAGINEVGHRFQKSHTFLRAKLINSPSRKVFHS